MTINEPIHKTLLQLQGSRQFIINTKEQKYKVRRIRKLPEVRVFRLLFPRIIAKPMRISAQTKFRFRLDGVGIFMFIMLFGALFTPWIPMEEGEVLDYHPIVPFLLFAYYVGFLFYELRTTKNLIKSVFNDTID